MLVICTIIHVGSISLGIPVLAKAGRSIRQEASWRVPALLVMGVAVIVAAHTVQIWFWAYAFLWVEAFSGFEPGFYFALVTYTTLGYGDLVLQPSLRTFAAFASITGLLTFGISTAFLIGVLTRVMPAFSEKTSDKG